MSVYCCFLRTHSRECRARRRARSYAALRECHEYAMEICLHAQSPYVSRGCLSLIIRASATMPVCHNRRLVANGPNINDHDIVKSATTDWQSALLRYEHAVKMARHVLILSC